MVTWISESLKKKLFEMLSNGEKINPQSIGYLEGYYRCEKGIRLL
ncbi:hypothetical protein ACSVDA_02400 [Cytobacillus sp. Hm23]